MQPNKNSLPFREGRLLAIREDQLTPGEKKVLHSVGWQDGDPIPSNLKDLIDPAALEKIRAQGKEVIDEEYTQKIEKMAQSGAAPFVPPPEVDIRALDDATQQRLRDVLRQAKQQAAEIAASAKDDINMIENESVRRAAAMAAANGEPVQYRSKHNAQLPPVDNIAPVVMLSTPFDQKAFMLSVSAMLPFEKQYELYNGAATVTFREIDAVDLRAIYRELRGLTNNKNAIEEELCELRCAASLSAAKVGAHEVVDFSQMYAEYLTTAQAKVPNKFAAFRDQVMTSRVMRQGRLWSDAVAASIHFYNLIAELRRRANDPNFWKAIES